MFSRNSLLIFLFFGPLVGALTHDIVPINKMLHSTWLYWVYSVGTPVAITTWVFYSLFFFGLDKASYKRPWIGRWFLKNYACIWRPIVAAAIGALTSFSTIFGVVVFTGESYYSTYMTDQWPLLFLPGAVCGILSTLFLEDRHHARISPRNLESNLYSRCRAIADLLIRLARESWWLLPILLTSLIFFLFYNGTILTIGDTLEKRAQFGDSFGVLNSLFSGLAFGGLIVTLLLQQKQIHHQENETRIRRKIEESQHYEEIFHRLLSIYSQTLSEVSNNNKSLTGRSVLRGAVDRAYREIKDNKVNLIPQPIQHRHEKNRLTDEDRLLLDYLYFRNFKILTVEIDRQARLVETFKVLLRHTVHALPTHTDSKPYFDLIKAQVTYVEASYFFLVALAFNGEYELRELLIKSRLVEKIANTKILRVHEMMYEEFWSVDIKQHKLKHELPLSNKRISQAIRAYKKITDVDNSHDLRIYTSPRVTNGGEASKPLDPESH